MQGYVSNWEMFWAFLLNEIKQYKYVQQLEDYTRKVLPRIRCHVLSLHDFSNFWKICSSCTRVKSCLEKICYKRKEKELTCYWHGVNNARGQEFRVFQMAEHFWAWGIKEGKQKSQWTWCSTCHMPQSSHSRKGTFLEHLEVSQSPISLLCTYHTISSLLPLLLLYVYMYTLEILTYFGPFLFISISFLHQGPFLIQGPYNPR